MTDYEKLSDVAYDMYQCLITACSTWEDEYHNIWKFKGKLTDLGVLDDNGTRHHERVDK